MRKILVIVDMQKDFVTGALGTKEAVAIVPNVVKKIEEFDGPIFVTYDTHQENYLDTAEGKKLPVVHCVEETDGWMLDENVENALKNKNRINIHKPTFGSPELAASIRTFFGNDVEIELVGLCTDICVVSNALLLKANFYEQPITVDASCCAGVTPETHEAALTTMRMCQINIIE